LPVVIQLMPHNHLPPRLKFAKGSTSLLIITKSVLSWGSTSHPYLGWTCGKVVNS